MGEAVMANQQLSKEEQLIAFFVNACNDPIGRTRLMKLLYLADYQARRYLGKPISNIRYKWHDFGPFDENLYVWLENLERQDLIRHEEVRYDGEKVAHVYAPTETPPALDLSPDEVDVLSFVCREYSQVALRQLLDEIVYQTEPMLDAKTRDAKGQALKMEMVDNAKRRDFTIPYAELLARSRKLKSGQGVSHREAMRRVSAALYATA
jgi:uncharacterized phage-associated protein